MAQPVQPVVSQPFTRLTHPDPQINAIVQDLYNKLQQVQAQVVKLINK